MLTLMASAFVVIFANDVPYSGEIKRHELGFSPFRVATNPPAPPFHV
jgi:hypothetical protein